MKKSAAAVLVLILLNAWVPFAQAEISQDLDPMVSVDPQATMAEGTSTSGVTTGQASGGVSIAATTTDEKKEEGPKKEKSKKAAKKKSSEKKKTKPSKSSKKSKSGKHSSR